MRKRNSILCSFGQSGAKHRRAKGLSQEALAEKAGYPEQKITEITLTLINGLCEFLFNCPLDMLIERHLRDTFKTRLTDRRFQSTAENTHFYTSQDEVSGSESTYRSRGEDHGLQGRRRHGRWYLRRRPDDFSAARNADPQHSRKQNQAPLRRLHCRNSVRHAHSPVVES
jgi:transcriptional regulator with XRE-family HTH domain